MKHPSLICNSADSLAKEHAACFVYTASKTDILHSVKQAQGGEHAVVLRVVVPQLAIVTAFGTCILWQHCDSKSKHKSLILTAEFVRASLQRASRAT